jgi:hypothetical protein
MFRGGREVSRYLWIPDSLDDLARPEGFVHDLLDAPARARVVGASEAFTRDWDLRLGLGRLEVNGFPLASLVHLQFKSRLNHIFLLLEFALRAVSLERPDTVFLSGMFSDEVVALRHAFGTLGVGVREGPAPRAGGAGGMAFRLGYRFRRVAEITVPRYRSYLRRLVRADRTPAPREDPRLLLADSFCLTPEAAAYLRNRGTLLHVLETDGGIRKILRKAGLPFRSVALRGARPAGWPSRENTRFAAQGAGQFEYGGIPFFPLIDGEVRKAVWETAPRLFAYGSLPEEGFRKVVLREQNGPEGKMLVWLFRRAGTPTVMMQHGLMVCEYGYLPMDADVFVAWGEEGRRWMGERGVPPERVEVIGCPRFDGYSGREAAKEPVGVFGRRLLLVFESVEYSGEDSPADNYHLLRMVLDAVAPLDGWRLAIRFHPAQAICERDMCRRLVEPLGDRVRVAMEIGPSASLGKADVVLTEASTVGMEALLRGKLLLVTRAKGVPGNPYTDGHAIPCADSAGEIRSWLLRWDRSAEERAKAKGNGKTFLDGHLHREEEPAGVRFWKYCLS